jgi:addiction module RelB/DinJ family antitoxin
MKTDHRRFLWPLPLSCARIDETLKDEAAAVLAELGLTVSDVVRMTLTRIAKDRLAFRAKGAERRNAGSHRSLSRNDEVPPRPLHRSSGIV